MATLKQDKERADRGTYLPEHGPIDEKSGKEILLSLKNVDITFGKGEAAVRAVQNATFDIYKGETFSLVGESGSGKTTVGRAVIRVNPLAGGEIQYKGVRISGKIPHALDREVIRNIQMVFQDPAASLNERATVDYIISEGLYNFHLFDNEADRVRRVEEMINEVGLLPEHLTRYPHEFQEEKNLTYLFIAHDLSVVRFISDRIGVIYKGRIVEVAEAEELFNFPLHPYTHSLISAIPIPDPKLEKNKVLYTYDPSIHDYSTDQPELVCIGHDHYIYGNQKEIAEYKAIRERDIPVKPIQIVDSNASEQRASSAEMAAEAVVEDDVSMIHPRHDTGSLWYTLVSFLLPILGLIAAVTFKHFHHFRNYKACRKGAIAGFIFLAALVVIFLLLLLITVM